MKWFWRFIYAVWVPGAFWYAWKAWNAEPIEPWFVALAFFAWGIATLGFLIDSFEENSP